MRIAFFGGTFDPIHRGHLRLAAAAASAFTLDEVLFAPVGHQPLKSEGAISPFSDRLAMTRLALEDPATRHLQPATCRFLISSLDSPHAEGTPNYTVDTLQSVALACPGANLFALVGADSFLDIRRWRSPDQLLALAEWIVVSRPEFPLTEGQLTPLSLTTAQRARVHFLNTIHEDVSSTELRRRLRVGDPCAGVIPIPVADYIQTHYLYR